MISGKVVLITGSSTGIGAQTAIHFASQGADVTITGRNVEKLNQVAKQCEKVSKKLPLVVIGDVGDEKFLKTLLDKTIQKYKKLDILVNNAGMVGTAVTTMEMYDKIFSINLDSVFILTKLAMPYLIQTQGCVVNNSSVSAIRPQPASVYSIAKAALDQFTRCLALELASDKVRVNSVNPGFIRTEILKSMGLTEEQLPQAYENFKQKVPIGKVGTVEEAAEAIAFLAGDGAKYMTGATLVLDGGYSLGTITQN